MFDPNNLVCRLFVAYCLNATRSDEYTPEGCLYIVNRFYDHVEKFQEHMDAYQRAARRTPLGFAAFFVNAERQYQLAIDNPNSELGRMLFNAQIQAAETPVPFPIYVRKNELGIWKFYQKLARGRYELIAQYAQMIGFKSKTKAEKLARELENGGVQNTRKLRPSRIVFEDSTEVEKHIVYGSAFHGTAYIKRDGIHIALDWHPGLNCFYPKSMPIEKVRELCQQ